MHSLSRVVLGALTLLLAGSSLVLAQPAPLSTEDLARIRWVREAVVSPDGGHVAYLRSIPRDPFQEENGSAWVELHVYDLARGESRPYVSGKVQVREPRWTPDGEFLLYLAKRENDEHRALYAIPLRGGESRRLLAYGSNLQHYALSPDGRQVAFLAERPVDAERAALKEKGFDAKIYEEDEPFVEVAIRSLDPSADPAAASPEPRVLPLNGSASLLRWSPVDHRLLLALAPTPLIDDEYMYRTVHVVDSRDGTVLATVQREGKLQDLRWSPDGRWIAMLAGEDLHDPDDGRLMVAPASGGAPVDLRPGLLAKVRTFRWLDADTILHVVERGLSTELARVDVDGDGVDTLRKGAPLLHELDLSADGSRAVAVADAPGHPTELFLLEEGAAPRRLTDSNPWLAERRLAAQEPFRYTARDGLELEGVLVRPLDVQGPAPLVLIVHGGPEAHVRDGWNNSYSRPSQVLAARGMAVFFPNYRGSTGRGVEFSKLSQGDPAGREFDDVVDAIDALTAAGVADPTRVGITGGSYGGYATAWGATYYSERFAAGVMFVGISDNISKFGTTEIPDEMVLVHQRQRVYDDWQFSLERSPIYHAHQNRTPLLILHGDSDPRVHPSQSMEMYRHVKQRGSAPVRLVFYPGEEHGNRKAAARYDYSLRAIRWLEHYLQGPGGEMPPHELEYGQAGEGGLVVGSETSADH